MRLPVADIAHTTAKGGTTVFGIRRPGLVAIVVIATAVLLVLMVYMLFASGLYRHLGDYRI